MPARVAKISVGGQAARRANSPAATNAPSMTTTTIASRTGLSHVPKSWMAGSTTEPGVARMIPSDTATRGDSRTLSAAAMAWLTARPVRPANTPAEAQAPRVDRIVPMYLRTAVERHAITPAGLAVRTP